MEVEGEMGVKEVERRAKGKKVIVERKGMHEAKEARKSIRFFFFLFLKQTKREKVFTDWTQCIVTADG